MQRLSQVLPLPLAPHTANVTRSSAGNSTRGDNATFSAAGNTTVNTDIAATNSANTTALVQTIGASIILDGNLSLSSGQSGTIGMTYLGIRSTSNRTFQIGNGNGTSSATISSSGSGALVFTASSFKTADSRSASGFGNRTVTLTGSNTSHNEI